MLLGVVSDVCHFALFFAASSDRPAAQSVRPWSLGARRQSGPTVASMDRRHRLHWPPILVVAASVLLGTVSLIYPFGRDQGIHAYIADSMLSGKVVYRDVFNIKPPLTTVVHALALLLFGHSMTAIRILDLIWTVATALAVFAFASRALRSRWLGAAAGCLYPLFYFPLGYWHTSQTDGWLNLPVAGTLVLFVIAGEREGRASRLLWLASGICCGLAILLKYTIGALPFLLALMLLLGRRRDLRRAAAAVAWLLLGVLVPLVLCALVLLVSGAMRAFVESQFGLVPAYAIAATKPGLLARFEDLVVRVFFRPSLQLPAAALAAGTLAGALVFLRRPDWRPGLRLWAVWLLAAFLSTFVQGKFFTYHYLPLLPLAAVAGALLAIVLPARLGRARVPVGIALAAVLIPLAGFLPHLDRLVRVTSGKMSVRDYWVSDLHHRADFSLRDDIELADHLRQTTQVTDRVFIWGCDPAVLFLAKRGSVTRFLYNLPMITDYAPQRFREEFMRAYVRDPAEVFVVEHDDAMPGVIGSDKDSYAFLQEFPELLEFVGSEYHSDTKIGRFDVLRLNERP